MPWWAWALLGWAALSVPVAVVVGRAIRLGDGDGRSRPTGDLPMPAPREGEGSIDDLSA
jgi:hypothetical protein